MLWGEFYPRIYGSFSRKRRRVMEQVLAL